LAIGRLYQSGHAVRRKAYAGALTQKIKQTGKSRRDELGRMSGLQRDKSYARIRRSVHAFPNWVDRIGVLGNAMDPRVVEIIGYAILDFEAGRPENGLGGRENANK